MPPEAGQGLVSAGDGSVQFTEAGAKALVDMFDKAPTAESEVKEPEIKETPKEEKTEPPKEEHKEPEQPVKRKFTDLKVDGEVKELEVDESEERELLQKGLHYTKEMQALREKERNLSPYEALIKQLQTDPSLNQHIASYYAKGKEPPKEEKAPTFDDPIDQLKYEIKQEARKEILGEIKKEFVEPMSHQAIINRVRSECQADPMYREIQGEIVKYVQSQPPSIGRTLAMQLDQDPKAYLEVFQATKERLATTKTETKLPEPIKKEEKAPILEKSGNDIPQPSDEKKKAAIDKKKAKAFQSGSTEDLAAFLAAGGFVKHLL